MFIPECQHCHIDADTSCENVNDDLFQQMDAVTTQYHRAEAAVANLLLFLVGCIVWLAYHMVASDGYLHYTALVIVTLVVKVIFSADRQFNQLFEESCSLHQKLSLSGRYDEYVQRNARAS